MSADVDAVLQEVSELRNTGDLAAAEKILNEAHRSHPDAIEFIAHLGDVHLAQGRARKAADDFRKAIDMAPGAGILHASLATALDAAGDTEGAVHALIEATRCEPDNASYYNNLGLLQRRAGKARDAVASLEKAIELTPERASFHANLARVLQDDGQLERARVVAEQSLELDPESGDALVNYGCVLRDLGLPDKAETVLRKAADKDNLPEAWLNLGLACRDMGENDKAIAAFHHLVDLQPGNADAHANLGRVLHEACRFEESQSAYNLASSIRPGDAQTLSNHASMLLDWDQSEAAEKLCRLALESNPTHVPAISNLANLRSQMGDQQEALELNQRAQELASDDNKIKRNRADPLFLSGELPSGWKAYDYRWHETDRPRRPLDQPLWQGDDISDQGIIVWSEQGIGDTILFASCLSDLQKRCKDIRVELDQRLVSLFRRSFPDVCFFPRMPDPHPDLISGAGVQCPIGDLGKWLRQSIEDFPTTGQFLTANPDRISVWREWLASLGPGTKAGFCWTSGLMDAERWRHYPDLNDWEGIFSKSDIQFINFQYGDKIGDLSSLSERYGNRFHVPPDLDLFNDLDNIAALTIAMDIFVSPETANAWLSGALGIPTFVMCQPGDWRTMGTNNLPWLPTVNMIEKSRSKSWRDTCDEVAVKI